MRQPGYLYLDGRDRMDWRPFYAHYAATLAPGDVLMKVDDDIAWVDVAAFPRFLAFRRARPDVFLMFPNIVNNGVTAWIQQRRGCIPKAITDAHGAFEYPPAGARGSLWESGDKALALHAHFVEHPGCFLSHDGFSASPTTGSDAAAAGEAVRAPHRFSINFFAVLGRHAPWLAQLVDAREGDDEDAATSVAARTFGAQNEVFMGFAAAHATYQPQNGRRDAILALYRDEGTAVARRHRESTTKEKKRRVAGKKKRTKRKEGGKKKTQKKRKRRRRKAQQNLDDLRRAQGFDPKNIM